MKLPDNEKDLEALIEAAQLKVTGLRKEKVQRRNEYAAAVLKRARQPENKVVLLAKDLPELLWVAHGKVGRSRHVHHGLKAGDTLERYTVQPRAGRIWATDGKHAYCFESFAERALIEVYPDELSAQVAFAAKRGPVFEL